MASRTAKMIVESAGGVKDLSLRLNKLQLNGYWIHSIFQESAVDGVFRYVIVAQERQR